MISETYKFAPRCAHSLQRQSLHHWDNRIFTFLFWITHSLSVKENNLISRDIPTLSHPLNDPLLVSAFQLAKSCFQKDGMRRGSHQTKDTFQVVKADLWWHPSFYSRVLISREDTGIRVSLWLNGAINLYLMPHISKALAFNNSWFFYLLLFSFIIISPPIEKNANPENSEVSYLNLIVDRLSRILYVICISLPTWSGYVQDLFPREENAKASSFSVHLFNAVFLEHNFNALYSHMPCLEM